ncbi:MAG: hypothetical protein K0Q55_272 [Verrucomicrobia bacterium]|jgi:hypothetical protein|nr:hypothetical protein [Verrucomicrobiota bacterium]
MLKQLFSYVPAEPPPEAPETEPPDPNADRALSESLRSARRTLMAWCAVCLAWSTAQFTLEELNIDAAGLSINLKNASIPLLLGLGLIYLTARWIIEFAMMPRHVRRWPLARIDFKLTFAAARFSILAVTAGALNRSVQSILAIIGCLCILGLVFGLLTLVLMLVTTPIRLRARRKAKRESMTNAVGEAFVWSTVFALFLTATGTAVFAYSSYKYEAVRAMVWTQPPEPIAFTVFVLTLIAVFLSVWFFEPLQNKLFGERPGYFTKRSEDGRLIYTFDNKPDEPIL